jgi:hypothetical protein
MTRSTLRIFAPVLIWALHFSALYALISAACAPRGLIGVDLMAALAAILTGVAAIACLALLLVSGRAWRRRRGDAATAAAQSLPLEQAAWWTALISLLSVLANVWPVATLPGCAG